MKQSEMMQKIKQIQNRDPNEKIISDEDLCAYVKYWTNEIIEKGSPFTSNNIFNWGERNYDE